MEKELEGANDGGWAPNYAALHPLEIYQNGSLKLDERTTKRYELDEINRAFEEMLNGDVIRGVVNLD